MQHDACLERDIKEIQENVRPMLAKQVENIAQYDVIFIGYPIWYYQAPMLLNTFLESYNLENKIIIPFCTSGGYPIDKSVNVLKESAKEADIKNGLRVSENEKELHTWLRNMGFSL